MPLRSETDMILAGFQMDRPETTNDPIEIAIREAEYGNYPAAAPVLSAAIEGTERAHSYRELASAMSYYGLCVAVLKHDLRRAIELCERAVRLQPNDGRHYANLARVFMMAGNRRKALATLDHGIRRLPADEWLEQIRDSFGYRRPSVLSFIPRRHPLNRFLGRVRYHLIGRRH